MRRTAPLAAALCAAAIAGLTLVPLSFPGSLPHGSVRSGLPSPADFLRNFLLFAPLGAALARSRVGPRAVLAAALAFSAALELGQLLLPGRYASAWDVAANGLGAAAGALGAAALARPGALAWIGARAPVGVALALGASALLAGRTLPASRYFGHWIPQLAHLGPYAGRLESAELGGRPLRNGPLDDSAEVRARLAGDFALSLHLRAGPPPPVLAGLLLVSDADSREVLLLGLERQDLVVRLRDRASALGLETLDLRAGEALRGVAPGASVALALRRRGDRFEIDVDGRHAASLAPTLGRGWALLDPGWPRGALARSALDGLWMALLGVGPGLGLAAGRRAHLALAALGLWTAALPAFSAVGASPPWEWIGAALGVAAGRATARRAARAAQPRAGGSPR
jgi:hypothetical protein